jgi:hypothetical protein
LFFQAFFHAWALESKCIAIDKSNQLAYHQLQSAKAGGLRLRLQSG